MPGLSDEIKVANLTICCETRDEAYTSATSHRDSYGQSIYDAVFCLLRRRTNKIFKKV